MMISLKNLVLPLAVFSAGLGMSVSLEAKMAEPGRECYRECNAKYTRCVDEIEASPDVCLARRMECYAICDQLPDD
jgi:hypothetical protein